MNPTPISNSSNAALPSTEQKRIRVGFASPTKFSIPIPINEAERLKALRRLAILDTPQEEVFNQIADLASFLCGTPIAAISLVDSDRQWFKAKVGITANETPRDIAFCAHAIMQTELFMVKDTTLDPRFAANPLVSSEAGIRFYAGAPLVSQDQHVLGTLCVIDKVPRELSPTQQEVLRKLSRQVVTLLEMRRELRELDSSVTNVGQGKPAKPQPKGPRLRD